MATKKAATEPDGLRIAQEIALGRADDQLAAVINAITDRQVDGQSVICWKVSAPDLDLEVTEEDFTVGEAEAIERDTGLTWDQVAPARSASVFLAVVKAALVARKGMTADAAAEAVRALPVSAAVAGISFYDGLPKTPPTAPDA